MSYSIKEIREMQKMTQQETADKLGIPLDTYRSWESDISSVQITDVMAIADLFGISLKDIRL